MQTLPAPRFPLSAMLLSLMLVGLARATSVYVVPGACPPTQYNYRAYVHYAQAPGMAEPNAPMHAANLTMPVLCPIDSTDPNLDAGLLATWERPVGRWLRTAPICLPHAGWSLEGIECLAGTTTATVGFDAEALTWTLAADVRQGPNWWMIRATSRNVADPRLTASRIVFVSCLGMLRDTDAGPILAALTEWLQAG